MRLVEKATGNQRLGHRHLIDLDRDHDPAATCALAVETLANRRRGRRRRYLRRHVSKQFEDTQRHVDPQSSPARFYLYWAAPSRVATMGSKIAGINIVAARRLALRVLLARTVPGGGL